MNWKFWTKEFWVSSEPISDYVCDGHPEFHEKEVLEPYVFPDPAIEFPVLKDGATEEVHANLSELFDQVQVPLAKEPVQDPVLMDAVLKELDKKSGKSTNKRKRVKKDPLIDAAAKTIDVFESYPDVTPVKVEKASKKAVKKSAPKKTAKKK